MKQQPFFVGHGLRRLDDEGDVRQYLHPELFRKRRGNSESMEAVDAGNWVEYDRDTLVHQLGTGEILRAVLTTDAGVGKIATA